MSVRFILGRAGSGKTWWCQDQICRELTRSMIDGPRILLLVPEQAALQMERGLLTMLEGHNLKALGRCEVLSFRRLANRIFSESTGPSPIPLSPLGRQMTLRLLISRHRKSLREFDRVAERGNFIREVSRGITELIQECVTLDQLSDAAAAAEAAADPTASRLHDVALLYRAYLEHLGAERVDPEGTLDLARTRLAATPWVQGARILVDGFAGLTAQQTRMLIALAQVSARIDIALLLDPAVAVESPGDEAEAGADALFARTEQTAASLIRSFAAAGIPIEKAIKLTPQTPPRFAKAPTLARLEHALFEATPAVKISDYHADSNDTESLNKEALPPDLTIVRAPNRRQEVDAAVRLIRDLTQRDEHPLRYRDIAIIVRDLEPYHDLLSASLHAHGIPCFIDRRRPTHHHPLVQLVSGLVSLVGGRRFDESIVRILKTGLSGLSNDATAAIENYTIAFGLQSAAAWERRWTRPLPNQRPREGARGDATMTDEIALVESARRSLVESLSEWWPEANANRAHPKGSTWARRLFATLKALGAPEMLETWRAAAAGAGRLDEAAEHEHVWSELITLLEELDKSLGDESMTGRQFREVIESGLADFTLGLTPPTLDQLLVSSIERSRHPAIKAAFILGFCEGSFPARATEETIFGDAERAFLSARDARLGRSRDEQQLDERALAYIAFTRPSDLLVISYPEASESGRPLEPSSFLNDVLGAVPEARIHRIESECMEAVGTASSLAGDLNLALRDWAAGKPLNHADQWLGIYEWVRSLTGSTVRAPVAAALHALAPRLPATLSKAALDGLWKPPYRTSVTQLESFAQCPFRHFARYGLHLTERAEFEVSQLHLGNLYHEVLEHFINELIATGEGLADLTDDQIRDRLVALCERILPGYAEQLGLVDAQRDKVSWRANLELPFALRAQKATTGRTNLRPAHTERHFAEQRDNALPALVVNTSDGKTVQIRGKIDRIDLLSAGQDRIAAVFDYKRTMGRRLALDEVYHGLALQLLAYLLVLRDAGLASSDSRIIPGGAFYLPLLGRFERVDHPTEADQPEFDPFSALRPRGVIDFDWIDRIDPTIAPDPEAKPGDQRGESKAFAVKRSKEGEISYLNSSDAVPGKVMSLLLEHVRSRLAELSDRWLTGDIRVYPIRHGRTTPCTTCPYRPVCRFEFSTHETRTLPPLSRTAVIQALTGSGHAGDEMNDAEAEGAA